MTRIRRTQALQLGIILGVLAAQLDAQTTVVRAARLLDVTTGEIRQPGVIVVEGGQIRSVGASTLPLDATVIDVATRRCFRGSSTRTSTCRMNPGRIGSRREHTRRRRS